MSNRIKCDVDTETALLIVEQGKLLENSPHSQQEERERMIAQSYEMAGQIKATRMIAKFGDVTSFMFLKQVKESKIYRNLPGIGTWEEYCKYVGLDRHTTDQHLLNLAAFGEQFLEIVTNLRVGYRDLRKLRQLSHDGTVVIDAECLKIGGETIPINPDHAEDLQAAIERIITEKTALNDRVTKLEKKTDEIVKEETKGLQVERDMYAKEVKRLKVFEPAELDREWCVTMMAAIKDATIKLELACRKFIIDERLDGDQHLQAKVESHMKEAELRLQDLRIAWDDRFYRDTNEM